MKLPICISTQCGTTLLELLVSISIMAIVSQISLSFLPNFLALNRANNQISLLHRHITYARLYAIENNSYVTLCALEANECINSNWHNQLSIFVDKDKSATLNNDDKIINIFEHTHNADTLEYPRNAITFRPDGTLNGFQNGTFVYCPNSEESALEGVALSVSQTGRIRIRSTDKCTN